MTVARILNQKISAVMTAQPADSLQSAAEKMARHTIGALAVVDASGTLVGLLTERDVVRAMAEKGAAAGALTVAQVMTAEAPCCTPEQSEGELLQMMTERRTRHLPVLQEGRLSGLVSLGDVVRLRLEKLKDYMAEIEQELEQRRFTSRLKARGADDTLAVAS